MSKNNDKNGGNPILTIIIIIAIVALIIWLLNYLGLGFGFGKGKGGDSKGGDNKGNGSSTAEAVSAAEDQTKTSTITYQEITVSGEKYIVNGQEKELDEVIADAKALAAEGNAEFRIIDDGAMNDALEDLTSALDNEKLSYNFQQKDADPSEAA
ncbi:MAG: hypothetical protein IJ737_06845 [Ruminococcus sp.]|nr:hypothetical protein [Ruminococcus sp.]